MMHTLPPQIVEVSISKMENMFYLCAVPSSLGAVFSTGEQDKRKATLMTGNEHITLQVHYLTRGTQLAHAHILILKHSESDLHLPVLITEEEAEALKNVVEKGHSEDTALALQILKALDTDIRSIHIVPDLPGRYHALVVMQTAQSSRHTLTCPVVKGVCLAIATKQPLLMAQADFLQHLGQMKDNGHVAFPLPAMTDRLLDEALQVAIDEENYELAATLHREIKTRKQSDKPQS